MTTETKGKGFFAPTPLQFSLDGKDYTYAGRGRWSVQLARVVLNGGKAPEKQKDGTWGWRDATPAEVAAAQKLVGKVEAKARAKAEAAAQRLASKAAKKVAPPEAAPVTQVPATA